MKYIERLPSGYDTRPGSNNAKLLDLGEMAAGKVRAGLCTVSEAADLNLAFGGTLDLYGEMVGLARSGMEDGAYRMKIAGLFARNFVLGTARSVSTGIAGMLGVSADHVALRDHPWRSGLAEIVYLPYVVLLDAGVSAQQAIKLIEELLPVGVRLFAVLFEGTFCFGAEDDEYDEETGFSDHYDPEHQTMGGFLGYVFDEEAGKDLRING